MPNIPNAQYPEKKLDLAAIRTDAKLKRIRARIMRANAALMRVQVEIMRTKSRNLRAITQEWFIR